MARHAGALGAVVYRRRVERVDIALDHERAEKLSRLAERVHVQPGTVESSS